MVLKTLLTSMICWRRKRGTLRSSNGERGKQRRHRKWLLWETWPLFSNRWFSAQAASAPTSSTAPTRPPWNETGSIIHWSLRRITVQYPTHYSHKDCGRETSQLGVFSPTFLKVYPNEYFHKKYLKIKLPSHIYIYLHMPHPCGYCLPIHDWSLRTTFHILVLGHLFFSDPQTQK